MHYTGVPVTPYAISFAVCRNRWYCRKWTKEWRGQAECTEERISCDECRQWFCYQCANIYIGNTPPGRWYCKACSWKSLSHPTEIKCELVNMWGKSTRITCSVASMVPAYRYGCDLVNVCRKISMQHCQHDRYSNIISYFRQCDDSVIRVSWQCDNCDDSVQGRLDIYQQAAKKSTNWTQYTLASCICECKNWVVASHVDALRELNACTAVMQCKWWGAKR